MADSHIDSPGVPLLPPIAFGICLATGIIGELLVPSSIVWVPVFIRILAGAIILYCGIWILAKGFTLFLKVETDPLTTRPASSLVTFGVYQYCRNPMYIGEISFLASIGILWGSYWIFAGAVCFGLYLRYHVIRREEAYLLRRFGDNYTNYYNKVGRWW